MTTKYKVKGRLFTFGCSFTSYGWPTWADILGREADSFENWARPSAGNHHILASLSECLNKNNITANDTIIILYSGITRVDFYQQNSWLSNIYKNDFRDYSREPISCPDGFELINFSYFYLIDKLLSNLNLNYYTFRWMHYNTHTRAGKMYKDVVDKIQFLSFPIKSKKIWRWPEFDYQLLYDRVCGSDWPKYDEIYSYDKNMYSNEINNLVESRFLSYINNRKELYTYSRVIDSHPSPKEHLGTIQKHFYVSNETRKWAIQMDENYINGKEVPFNKNLATRF